MTRCTFYSCLMTHFIRPGVRRQQKRVPSARRRCPDNLFDLWPVAADAGDFRDQERLEGRRLHVRGGVNGDGDFLAGASRGRW